jgi:hypothetical protein
MVFWMKALILIYDIIFKRYVVIVYANCAC